MKTNNIKKCLLFLSLTLIIILTIYGICFIDFPKLLNQIEQYPFFLKAIVMIILNTFQIVLAFIPGEPLELASGYLFGNMTGTFICLIASAIGTIIVYFLVYCFKHQIINILFSKDKIDEVENFLSNKKSQFWIYIIMLLPGTPKDVLTYVASLGNLNLLKWTLLTTLCRIPSIITSTYLSDSIKNNNFTLAIIIFIITILFVSMGSLMYQKLISQKS